MGNLFTFSFPSGELKSKQGREEQAQAFAVKNLKENIFPGLEVTENGIGEDNLEVLLATNIPEDLFEITCAGDNLEKEALESARIAFLSYGLEILYARHSRQKNAKYFLGAEAVIAVIGISYLTQSFSIPALISSSSALTLSFGALGVLAIMIANMTAIHYLCQESIEPDVISNADKLMESVRGRQVLRPEDLNR
jgi:hypothetical protein